VDSIVIFEFTFFYAMFYRIVAFALVGLGVFQIIDTLNGSLSLSAEKVELSAMGLASVFLGLLNIAYVYEIPESNVPKIVLLSANLLFIGYSIKKESKSLCSPLRFIYILIPSSVFGSHSSSP